MLLTYRYRLLPSKGQHARLREALEHSRQLYNAALEERIDCYRKTGRGRTFVDQCRALTEYRRDGSPYAATMQRAPLKAADLAFRAFFARGGFPRFKGREWFKSIGWSDDGGWSLKRNRFWAKGLGSIAILLHRPLPTGAKAPRIKRHGRNWYLTVAVEMQPEGNSGRPKVGIDAGIEHLAALSTGKLIPNHRPYRRSLKRLKVKQRALARCQAGSNRRKLAKERLARVHRSIARARTTYLHQVSSALTREYGMIAIEALNVKGLAKSQIAQSVNDASWAKLFSFLRYKAERAGGEIVEVDPRFTSQTCPECGVIKPKQMRDRIHRCDCGCVEDRDVAAAKVILLRAVVHDREGPNVTDRGARAPEKAAA